MNTQLTIHTVLTISHWQLTKMPFSIVSSRHTDGYTQILIFNVREQRIFDHALWIATLSHCLYWIQAHTQMNWKCYFFQFLLRTLRFEWIEKQLQTALFFYILFPPCWIFSLLPRNKTKYNSLCVLITLLCCVVPQRRSFCHIFFCLSYPFVNVHILSSDKKNTKKYNRSVLFHSGVFLL